MNRYTKRPVTIEASDPIDAENANAIAAWCGGLWVVGYITGRAFHSIRIDTLEGVMTGSEGDRIIRGVQGEFYPCKPDIFDATYVPAIEHGWGHGREDRTLWRLPIGSDGDSDGDSDGPLERTTTDYNMVGSELLNGLHSPVLDLDFEARLVPSSTPGHYHLFLDGLELDHDAYDALLAALVAAKVIQPGFRRRFTESGTTLARVRRDKTPGEPATGPIVVVSPDDAEKF